MQLNKKSIEIHPVLNMNHHSTALTRKDITMDYPNKTTNTYK